MSYSKQKLIDIALAEVGYLEKSSKTLLDDKTVNAGDQNYTKYARDLDGISFFNGRKQGAYWCAVFVCWCFYKAFGKAAALKLLCQPSNTKNNCGAGCKYAMDYYRAKGQLYSTPEVGDQIFFYGSDGSSISHTGLVYKVSGSRVYTVEGNTSGGSSVIANGGEVATKNYTLGYKRIAGYGRPAYGEQTEFEAKVEAPEVDDTPYVKYTVKRGDTLWVIAKRNYGAGKYYTRIKEFNGLTSDKIKAGEVLKIPAID